MAFSGVVNCVCHYFSLLVLTLPITFPEILFRPDGIFLERYLRHLFVADFLKSTLTTVFTITGITFTVLTFIVIVKEVLL